MPQVENQLIVTSTAVVQPFHRNTLNFVPLRLRLDPDGPFRYTYAPNTAPTTTTGFSGDAGQILQLQNSQNIENFKMIAASADVSFRYHIED